MNLTAPKPIGEKRVTLRNLDWQAYQTIRKLLDGRTRVKLMYDRGTLELTMPLEEHEFASELIALFIRILVFELGLDVKTMGSTTLDREDLDRGAQPDKGFYIQNYAQVAGREVDLSKDPPPDLIVEVDITNTDIDKNRLYANMGVSEFWRFNGQLWKIYQLQDGEYIECDRSSTFPMVEKANLYRFLAESKVNEMQAERNFRTWLQQKLSQG